MTIPFTAWVVLATGATSPGHISITAEPSRCLLGRDTSVTLTVRTEASTTNLALSTNTGTVGIATPSGAGVFTATYRPPTDLYPRNAIITALSQTPQGTEIGWLALPLWGQGTAEVKTRSRGRASVRIGSTTFGPAQADAAGLAKIPIEVPPGEQFAYDGPRAIDLLIPRTSNLHLVTGLPRLPADKAASVGVWLVTLNPKGQTRVAAPVALSAARGSLGTPIEILPGLWHTTLELAPGASGSLRLSATLADETHEKAEIEVDIVPGPPVTIDLSAEPEVLVAGLATTSHIRATARDAVGNAVAAALELSVDFGTLNGATEASPTTTERQLVVPENFGERHRARVTAAAGALRAEKVLALQGGAAVGLHIDVPPTLEADWRTTHELRVAIVDRFGNPTAGPTPTLSVQPGTLGEPRQGQPGEYSVELQPAHSLEPLPMSIEASIEGLPPKRVETLVPPGRSRLWVAAHAGLLTSTAAHFSPVGGLEAAGMLRFDAIDLGLLVGLDYSRFSGSTPSDFGEATSHTDLASLQLSATARLPLPLELVAIAEAGAGVSWLRTRVSVGGHDYPAEGTGVVLARGALGLGRRLGPGTVVLRAGVRWLKSPALASLRGNLTAVEADLGYRWDLW